MKTNKKNIVFICAHPDDFLSCVGLAIRVSEEYKCHVFDYTHGERGGKMSLSELRTIRTNEETKACAGLGVDLRFFEAVDGEAYADSGVCAAIEAALRELCPVAVFLHWPVDTHTDHVLSTAAGLEAIHNSRLYPTPEMVFFPEPGQSRDFTPDYIVDVSAQMDRKLEYIRCHESQNIGDVAAQDMLAYCGGYGANYGYRYAEVFRAFGPAGSRCGRPSIFDGIC